ncbi:hypothetical protein F5Y13DRAFT_60915 [Hypoxylon sp. FL1857]|nr:hypothetical protein F5Y13DRAFT_60915 [Hypoxylon sp. FL1857]
METRHIDELLERYLHLLHEYTTLRDQLNNLQAGMYQNIARANFAAERGMRFGPDHYDERMQAIRKTAITTSGDQDVPIFTITTGDMSMEPKSSSQASGVSEKEVIIDDDDDNDVRDAKQGGGKKGTESPSQKAKGKDPLRWFGLLTPMALRQAQAQSVEAVEQVIPKLVSVNAQMAQIEIEVRRARKKRAKAEAAAAKKEQEVSVSTEITA